jgi:Alpha amylase, catalytic domain
MLLGDAGSIVQKRSRSVTRAALFVLKHLSQAPSNSRSILINERMITLTPRRFLTLFIACILAAPVQSQVLARPGWAGSGISTDVWWKHPVVYQVNPINFSPSPDPAGSGLHGVAQHLDYIKSLGADALLLTPIQPDATHAQSIDPAYGTLDDLDDLIHEASRQNIRVLLDLDPRIPAADLPNVARFWLNRGIAGFHVNGVTPEAHAQAAELRKATGSYLGQRILIGDVDPTVSISPQQRTYKASDPQATQLLLDASLGSVTPLNPAAIRTAIESTEAIAQGGHNIPLLATDGPSFQRSMSRYADGKNDLAIAKLLATILFTTRAQPLLYYGQELGVPAQPASDAANNATPIIAWDAPPPPEKGKPAPTQEPQTPGATPNAALEEANPASLLNWYRRLIELHHGNATINSGEYLTINRDDQNVLIVIRKPKNVTPSSPVLIILCNLSAEPAKLSIKADTMKLHLRGSFLRTILRTDNGMGTMHLESMTLPPYTAYIGSLRF